MKSEKAKDFIEDNLHWEQDNLFGIRSFEVMYVDNAINAIELAESEYRERAIEAFCSFQCPNEEDIIGCIKDKVCASLELFIHALDNPKN